MLTFVILKSVWHLGIQMLLVLSEVGSFQKPPLCVLQWDPFRTDPFTGITIASHLDHVGMPLFPSCIFPLSGLPALPARSFIAPFYKRSIWTAASLMNGAFAQEMLPCVGCGVSACRGRFGFGSVSVSVLWCPVWLCVLGKAGDENTGQAPCSGWQLQRAGAGMCLRGAVLQLGSFPRCSSRMQFTMAENWLQLIQWDFYPALGRN